MLKNDVAVVGAGLGGATVAYGLQQKNYRAYLINGSEQDNRTIPDAKNVLILEGYDGLAGDRSLALEALQKKQTDFENHFRDRAEDCFMRCVRWWFYWFW